MDVVEKAKLFAAAAHAAVGQKRKYTLEPYIVHPEEVANMVKAVPHSQEMLAAAWLHDVLEDTEITPAVLQEHFGPYVTKLVVWLTDVSKPEDGNRAERKALDREYIANATPDAKTIKLADIISNCSSIIKHDPEFAKVYLEEKRLLLEVLTEGDERLLALARHIINS
jgi:(p)ppGpp synthase/HD superfamily hydrolase